MGNECKKKWKKEIDIYQNDKAMCTNNEYKLEYKR